jgi:Putative prokaryotic signal transducing protein
MDESLVVIRTFLNHFEADVARSALESAGIESLIRSDDCGGTRPHLWLSGVQLIVRQEDAERAAELLDSDARSATEHAGASDPANDET